MGAVRYRHQREREGEEGQHCYPLLRNGDTEVRVGSWSDTNYPSQATQWGSLLPAIHVWGHMEGG